MVKNRYQLTRFSKEDIRRLQPAMKVGILATVNPQGLPHLTLITTLMASSPEQVVWGQFMEGSSKEHVRLNPRTGFLIMLLDKNLWRGKADFTHTACEGKDYDYYNNTPLFRYNAYFGVHTVYYMDLLAHTGCLPLPMNRVVLAAVKTMAARLLPGQRSTQPVLNPWTQAFFNKLDNLKFLSYVGADDYPVVIPLIQAQALDREHLVFSTSAYSDELAEIPAYTSVAVFGMALTMEDVLVRGVYQGSRRMGGMHCGVVQIDWVYNPMPPKPMQIYPELAIQPVREF
jgi:hypothetical protein